METLQSLFMTGLVIAMAPLFPGVILKTKAFFAGKNGPPILIRYYTLAKLLRKGVVYSTSTTYVFRLGPVISLASGVAVLLFFPFAGAKPLLSFHGDVILLFYLMGLGRFFTVIAALDTASPFEGMGAAREVFFATLAEVTIFAILLLFYRLGGGLSFADYFQGNNTMSITGDSGPLMFFVVVALFMVLLVENSRVPVDDPATHLELTMIHEVMILDHSGPDLALIELGAFLKLMLYSSFLAQIIHPFSEGWSMVSLLGYLGLLLVLYILVGVVESITARLKMNLVPKFILTSFALVFFGVILTMGVLK